MPYSKNEIYSFDAKSTFRLGKMRTALGALAQGVSLRFYPIPDGAFGGGGEGGAAAPQ